jgi:hypothetical protein
VRESEHAQAHTHTPHFSYPTKITSLTRAKLAAINLYLGRAILIVCFSFWHHFSTSASGHRHIQQLEMLTLTIPVAGNVDTTSIILESSTWMVDSVNPPAMLEV